ncbi:MAG: LysR family transcriptional regulator [Oscillospiraceae bacterium]|nr:LysR family transcriptional regulator [Oscillospiraceae bacterium]
MTQLEIEAFLMTVKLGSISTAANSLFITQPALSRRIHALESELGYLLFIRGKGIRSAALTEEGKSFVAIAKKYNALWREAKSVSAGKGVSVKISSVGSVSTYLLPKVFSRFLAACPECSLQFNNYHSLEAYDYVAREEIDLAFISDDMFSREVYTVPLFREPMVLAISSGEKYISSNNPGQLDGADEIRLPWNPEYDLWHDYWFSPSQRPRVQLDQMSLLEYFLRQKDLWAILPSHVAACAKNVPGVQIRALTDGPPDSYIYYLTRGQKLSSQIELFLSLLRNSLSENDDITLID